MKIIFAGTPEFSVPTLKALSQTKHSIVAVLTQPDRGAGRGRKRQASPIKLFSVGNNWTIRQPEALSSDEIEALRRYDADLMVVIAYGLIIPKTLLEMPRLGCINLHASLLPRWRGAAPIQRAIEAGDTNTGVSLMKMEQGLDTGPVLATKEISIESNDTSASLHNKLATLSADLLIKHIDDLERMLTQAIDQDDTKAIYAKKIRKSEANINWSNSAKSINNQIRAFNPWPVAQSNFQGTIVRFWQASIEKHDDTLASPGEILSISKNGIEVACGQGSLTISQLQKRGGNKLNSREFCNGYKLELGQKFA